MMNLLAQQLRVSALQAEVSRFQRFAKDAPIGILFISSDATVQFANDEYLRIVGRSREEFDADRFREGQGRPPEWLHPELGTRHESEYVRSDGTRVPLLVGLSVQPDGVAAFVIDLTAEKAAERGRQESEERYRAIAEQLAEADRRKDEFFRILSHELRNPLAPIRNALHLLGRAPDDPARAARWREVIERQVGHLSRLVEDLLDLTRITAGRIQLRREPLDLAHVVGHTAEDHRAGFEAIGVRLVLQLPPAPVPVEGDETRIAQIVGNLLANSAKFTPDGGTVTVRVAEAPGRSALLDVRDTGEGIEAEVLPRIFEPFSQADRTLARSRGGLGLGLTLVKRLVELHGGTVVVTSAGPGAGTEVAVRFPLAATPRVPAPQVGSGSGARGAATVLVVEDNLDAAETLRDALELEGMEVSLAPDGEAGLAAARRRRPDLVICDIGLPGKLDGYGVARAFRADPALRDVRLVALTGYAGPEDRTRAYAAGFDLHLGKPAALGELLRAIAPLVRPGTGGDGAAREPR
ncbi:ATP-binding protein [Anaeromyxobacter sp. Fw109-5]|uniref:hybrid sensor histidine kinase/response regulator n=1 Tax=Anaeromyxobacter sp. (strain Fw109-5) TaxID=404589 RepID=UPI0000ED8193|nr:ATP-binding protein [Anaeromyxobacter sp. Fw109-5]ABS26208.1 PAS/PAC sensor hybrid histidine kinase [Anaeromyxobacter sp. Fw109-5]